jgi:hypothetical protein
MPLLKGKSNVGANIRELTEHGTIDRPRRQIIAIALHAAGVPKKRRTLKQLATGRA